MCVTFGCVPQCPLCKSKPDMLARLRKDAPDPELLPLLCDQSGKGRYDICEREE